MAPRKKRKAKAKKVVTPKEPVQLIAKNTISTAVLDNLVALLLYGAIEKTPTSILGKDDLSMVEFGLLDAEQRTRVQGAAATREFLLKHCIVC